MLVPAVVVLVMDLFGLLSVDWEVCLEEITFLDLGPVKHVSLLPKVLGLVDIVVGQIRHHLIQLLSLSSEEVPLMSEVLELTQVGLHYRSRCRLYALQWE